MTTLIRYTGTDPISETPITGRGKRWWPGELRSVESTLAAQLAAAGKGFEVERDGDAPDASGSLVSGAWLLPSGGDDSVAMMAAALLNRGRVYLGPGDFRLDNPFVAAFYGYVTFGGPRNAYVRAPKFFGAGNGITRVLSSVVGQAAVQINSVVVPEAVTAGGWYGLEARGISWVGPGFANANTCCFQAGAFSFTPQVTEQSRIACEFGEFTTAIRGDDTTGFDISDSVFRRVFIGCEFNYNADIFGAERCSFGDFYPANSGGTSFTNGSPNITLSPGQAIISQADCPSGGMLVTARANAGAGAHLLPAGTRVLTYNPTTGATVLSANATNTDANAAVNFAFGRAVVFRSALKVGAATFTSGSNVITSPTPTTWPAGLAVGQQVRGAIGANLQVFPLGTVVTGVSTPDAQSITVSNNATASSAGGGIVYVRDPYGIWEPPSANPGGGVPDIVEFGPKNWLMRVEGGLYCGDGGGIKFDGNYIEKGYSYMRIGWAGKTELPSAISFSGNKLSIQSMLVEEPIQILNKSSGTDSPTSVLIERNFLDAPRGAPYSAAGVLVPLLKYQLPALLQNNPTSQAMLRGSFEYRNNYWPGAVSTQITVDLGTTFGTYAAPVEGYEIVLKGIVGGNQVIPLITGSLPTWYGHATDFIYVRQPTGACTIPNWSGGFPFPGREITIVIEQGATPQDVALGTAFKDATGASLTSISGAGQANKRAALKFVHSGQNTCVQVGATVWQ